MTDTKQLSQSNHDGQSTVDSNITWPIATDQLQPKTLYLVSTPIGHLSDITLRALHVLQHVDMVLAEDTRHSKRLFDRYGFRPKQLIALHDHNEQQRAQHWADQLLVGGNIALISDAGTPLISDPGYLLVQHALEVGANVCPIPGPCAFVAALSASGLPTNDFRFLGFLPARKVARLNKLKMLLGSASVMGFYEAPHRLVECLMDIGEVFGLEHPCVLAHELTKRHEFFLRGSVQDCLTQLNEKKPRGEWVIWLGTKASDHSCEQWPEGVTQLLLILSTHLPKKLAAGIVADHYDLSKKTCYQWLVDHCKTVD